MASTSAHMELCDSQTNSKGAVLLTYQPADASPD
jgi:hypothetical protein